MNNFTISESISKPEKKYEVTDNKQEKDNDKNAEPEEGAHHAVSPDSKFDPSSASRREHHEMGKTYEVKNANLKSENVISTSVMTRMNSGEPTVKIMTKEEVNDLQDDEKNEEEQANGLGWKTPLIYLQIFQFATFLDLCLLLVGIVASVVSGVALPVLIILFGDLIEQMLVPLQEPQMLSGDSSNSTEFVVSGDMDSMMALFEDEMTDICIKMTIVGAAVFVASYFQITMVTLAGENILFRLRQANFKAVLRQDISWFDQQKTGTLVTRLADDTEKIRQGISDKIAICVQHSATFISGFVIAFVYGPKMAGVMCIILPPLAIGGMGFAKVSGDASADEQREYGEAGAVAEYTLSSIRTVVAFGGEPREIKLYDKKLRKARRLERRKATVTGGFLGWAFGTMFAGYGLAFWYGPKQIANDSMSVSEVMTVFFSVLMGAMSVGQAVPIFGLVSSVAASFEFVKAVIRRTPPIDTESEEGEKPKSVQGDISFRNVGFCYPSRPQIQILKNFSVEVGASQTVALVGASGSGKSTIVNLLQRFYSISNGEILLDGVRLEKLNLNWLREQIGLVSQEPVLFGCTIRENIEFGRENVTTVELDAAIKQANAKEFIDKLPKGVETLVGERGSQLSGGQKQRIAIARALVRNPKILLLDEATSALDSNSEKIVQDALDKARNGRTTIVIAHRLSTIKDADKIVVMMGGEIREVGKHEELISLNGIYSDLILAQSINTNMDEKISMSGSSEDNTSELGNSGNTNAAGSGVKAESSAAQGKVVDKDSETKVQASDLPGFTAILRLNKPEVIFIIIACIFAAIAQTSMPMFAIFFAELMEVFVLPDDEMQKEANFWALMFVVLGLTIGISMLTESWALGESGSRLTERLRSLSFKSMLKQDMSYFDDEKNYVGVLTTRLAKETSLVQGATGIRVKATLEAIVGMSAGLAIAFIFGWQLALLLLAAFPLIGIAGGIQMKFAQGFSVKESSDSQQGGKVVTESISNIRTVQSLGLEKRLYAKFFDTLTVVHEKNLKFAHVYGLAQSFSQSMFFFIYAAAFRFAAWLIARESIESMDAFRVTFALVFAATGIGQATSALGDFAKAQLATKSLLDLFSLTPKINNLSNDGYQVWEDRNIGGGKNNVHIVFKDVHFRYPSRPNVKILKSFNLEVPRGKTVALVGPSGCGKSTLMQLVQRFYDPEQGEILLDGYDIKQLNVRELRRRIAIVSQEPSLFNASIENNIKYGSLAESGDFDSSITLDRIIGVATSANLHSFVLGLPLRYDTNVGEKGTQISGGQKQRIAIARALIRDPEIILLDEATSALDSESEKVVQQALDIARVGRTCLVIAHRLTTIQNADEIVVLDQGEIVQRGTHEQLFADKSGLYSKFCQAQNLEVAK
ncbi:phosphatidylcholine translocator ABCB4-like isoform X2 [Symsagittifera roscoffensis]|uniref:phosphatidylcholine translocator ABCB4-like isoform X2 n=1 Tax=Symsagittifera roscoffensis TaxID=84072 RepID=UPI00307C81D1